MRGATGLTALLTAACMLVGCVTTSNFTPAQKGTVHRDVFDLGNGSQVPLPPGEWVLIANPVRTNSNYRPFYHPVLLDLRNNVLHGAMRISTATDLTQYPGFSTGYVLFKECGRRDIHFVKVLANLEGSSQDCWFVNHYTMTLGANPASEWLEARDYLLERGITPPINTVGITFHLADNRQRYQDVTYFFNPEAEGFSPPQYGEWRSSDWHKDRVPFDPKKKEYIEKLIAWGEAWHGRIHGGFAGRLAAPASTAAIRTPETSKPQPAQARPAEPQEPKGTKAVAVQDRPNRAEQNESQKRDPACEKMWPSRQNFTDFKC